MKVLPPPNLADDSKEGFHFDASSRLIDYIELNSDWSAHARSWLVSIIWKLSLESVWIRKFKETRIRNWKSLGRFEKWWTNNKSKETYRPSDEYFEGRWGRRDCRQTDNRSNSQWRKAIHSLLLFYLV